MARACQHIWPWRYIRAWWHIWAWRYIRAWWHIRACRHIGACQHILGHLIIQVITGSMALEIFKPPKFYYVHFLSRGQPKENTCQQRGISGGGQSEKQVLYGSLLKYFYFYHLNFFVNFLSLGSRLQWKRLAVEGGAFQGRGSERWFLYGLLLKY